ncbi:Holliday junction resolvase RuvX [candidate division WWE3 bacterium]|uniref:Putative pre-16S rRNA nuclease n=1 Tax=candidate division WWE3 bacterium TaxID=2053526 RepID=A0A7X9E7A1_UNCKA|nr:Holliday junction resolvase RuvX [candidate division WWE3 bacterium]
MNSKKIKYDSATILGVDYGRANIGLALGRNGLVTPLEVISAKNTNNALIRINRVVIENKVELIILGLPLTMEGKDTAESIEIRRFAKILKTNTKRPVETQNEYGSSARAFEEALDLGISEKHRKTNDHLAAAYILRMYYDDKGIE